MKLRNKKTGEIIDTAQVGVMENVDGGRFMFHDAIYDSLTELTEEWEDYEEHVKNDDKVFIDRIGDRINKFKKEFVEKDLTITNNKIELFNTICDIELDIKFYLVNGSDYAS